VVRVVLINFARRVGQVVSVKAAGTPGAASLVRLTAPSPAATSGVTLGGQSFGASTTTGVPAGQPKATQVPLGHVWVPPASAAILTLR
jgi:hypothetical protein